ncbi:MAG: alcohol dehydrogenase catalytic domain-containing protein [Nitrospiraceae bacterium]|nr:alcohol dehydrogenase catalytic domain-containing protein [Nitrospiraceae bacterium]
MKALYFENRLSKVLALKVAQHFRLSSMLGPLSALRYADVPEPRIPNPRWLKVRNLACGLCGTDLHFMFMDMDPRCFPAAMPGIRKKFLGHELVGEVVEVGVDAGDFAVGDRVAMRIDWPSCAQLEIEPPCAACAAGNYMLCQNLGTKELPLEDVGGGFSPYMVMHRAQPYKVPAGMDLDCALLLEPMACAAHAVLKSKPEPGERVLVIGSGTLGLLIMAALRTLAPEAEVACMARYPFQARAAQGLGAEAIEEAPGIYRRMADVTGARYAKGYLGNEILLGGFNRIYDTVGNDESIKHSLRWVKGGGSVVLAGINFKPGRIDYSPVWCQEVSLTGINCHGTEADGRTSFDVAAELLQAGCVRPGDFITHRFPLRKYKQAVKTFLSKRTSEAIKIAIDVADESPAR